MARTAVIAGTATAVSGRVSRRQQARWADQEAQQAPPPQPAPAPAAQPTYAAPPPQPAPAPAAATPSTADTIEQLKGLAELKSAGILTDAEFEAQKAKILGM
jgi:hypothetical protein